MQEEEINPGKDEKIQGRAQSLLETMQHPLGMELILNANLHNGEPEEYCRVKDSPLLLRVDNKNYSTPESNIYPSVNYKYCGNNLLIKH